MPKPLRARAPEDTEEVSCRIVAPLSKDPPGKLIAGPVEDLTQVVVALGTVLLDECQIWGDESPLFVGKVAGVWFSCSYAQMLPCASQSL